MDLLERAARKPGAKNLDRYVRTLNESFEYVLDANRVDNHTIFILDTQVVAPLHERAPNVTYHVVSADRLQAEQAIDDAERVERVLQARNVSYERATVAKELRLARQAFDRAEQQRNRSVVSAISKYRAAWMHAQRALDHMDWATTPNVTIDTRRDIPFEENTTFQVNGTVFDVRPYELGTLTLSHDNDTRTIKLPAETTPATVLTFNTSIVLRKPVNRISINSTDPNEALAPTDETPPPATGNDTLWIDSDGLPDEYEQSVTGTNPRKWDSNSNRTLPNEAGDDVSDGAEDFDADGVATYNEWVYGLDPFDEDTDGDDLTDQFELRTPGLDPSATDSDDNGTPDGHEDPDEDGLSNLREQELGTVPIAPDTDRDGLNESAEVEDHETDPLQADTDSDELLDGEEIDLGTDPLNNDTDGDGILDGAETYTTTTTNESVGASVAVTGEGNAASGVSISNESTEQFVETPVANATASNVVDLEASREFETAEISISYNASNETNEKALAVYRLDPTLQEFTQINSTIDPRNGSVSAEVDQPATYLVMDSQQWDQAFERDLPTRKNANTTRYNDSFTDLDGWSCDGDCAPSSGGVVIGESSAGSFDVNASHACPEHIGSDCPDLPTLTPTPTPTPSDPSPPPTKEWGTPEPVPQSTFERGITLGDDVIRAAVFIEVRGETSADGTASILISGESGSVRLFSLEGDETQNWTTAATEISHFVGEEITLHVETEGEATYLELSAIHLRVTRDSDDDGLPNSMELHGIRNYKGEVVTTDPFNADTDGDGISDDDEVGVYFPDYRESGYHFLYSDPTSADTDGDGLGDYEEIHENYEIVYTASPDATRGFFGALQSDDQNPEDFLTSGNPGSSAMQADSDDDGLSDREEVLLGTDAKSRDTDGDGIPDGEEDRYGGDPTLFDAQPPRIEVWYANFHKPAWSLKTEYTLSFTANDPSGVGRVAVVKDDKPRFEDYPSGYPSSISYGYVQFETGAGETLLDGLLGATVQVEAEDRHGNDGRITALERSNFYGHVASEYGSDSIYNEEIAVGAGLLSGFSVGAGETGEMVAAMANDPLGFIDSLTNILDILDKLGVLDDLIRALPDAIDRQQEIANPYDKETQPSLYGEFRKGWYGGYTGYFLLTMVVGAEKVFKVAKESSKLAKLVNKLDSDGKLRKAARLLEDSRRITPKDRMTTWAVTRADGYGMDEAAVIEDIGTAAKTANLVDKGLSKVDSRIYRALDEEGATRLGRLLVRKSDDEFVKSINNLDADTAQKVFSTSADDIGVRAGRMTEVRVSIIRTTNTEKLSNRQARGMMEHLEEVKGLDGNAYQSFARKIDNGDPQQVRSTKWELERTAHYRKQFDDSEITIEPLDDEIDLKAGNRYVEQKSLTTSSVNYRSFRGKYLEEAQRSFKKNTKHIDSSDVRRVEIDLKNAKNVDSKRIEDIIVKYSKTLKQGGNDNHIDEVEVFLSDGSRIKAVKNDNGIFEITS